MIIKELINKVFKPKQLYPFEFKKNDFVNNVLIDTCLRLQDVDKIKDNNYIVLIILLAEMLNDVSFSKEEIKRELLKISCNIQVQILHLRNCSYDYKEIFSTYVIYDHDYLEHYILELPNIAKRENTTEYSLLSFILGHHYSTSCLRSYMSNLNVNTKDKVKFIKLIDILEDVNNAIIKYLLY